MEGPSRPWPFPTLGPPIFNTIFTQYLTKEKTSWEWKIRIIKRGLALSPLIPPELSLRPNWPASLKITRLPAQSPRITSTWPVGICFPKSVSFSSFIQLICGLLTVQHHFIAWTTSHLVFTSATVTHSYWEELMNTALQPKHKHTHTHTRMLTSRKFSLPSEFHNRAGNQEICASKRCNGSVWEAGPLCFCSWNLMPGWNCSVILRKCFRAITPTTAWSMATNICQTPSVQVATSNMFVIWFLLMSPFCLSTQDGNIRDSGECRFFNVSRCSCIV